MGEADIGVIGGSGLYKLFENAQSIHVGTPYIGAPYGSTSDALTFGVVSEKKIAFMPRHGRNHNLPPHKIPYKANTHAFKMVGVRRLVAPTAVGSLQPEVKPGDFVICDQLVDRTHGRQDTYFDGPDVVHVSFAEPYCPELRKIAAEVCKDLNVSHHTKGTVVVINGPRFSTKAESKWFSSMGWSVINMTQYPESILAREMGMCYLNISLVTDYDAGLEGNEKIKPVTAQEVVRMFKENNEKVKEVIAEIIKRTPVEPTCKCSKAVEEGKM
ncbi:MAG: S-methyl-5'-thioadenosine phosphorylase [Candidatus Altiarchaeota archaeon]|nr:S-methyl-5'-thioadenosine phosphorylase [Candidatus Altiarchaeota archaeon]